MESRCHRSFYKKSYVLLFVVICLFLLLYDYYVTKKIKLMNIQQDVTTTMPKTECKKGASQGSNSTVSRPEKLLVWDERTRISKEAEHHIRSFWKENKFHVPPKASKRAQSPGDLQRDLQTRVPLVTIKAGDGPFSGSGWEKYLPKESLEKNLGPLKTCAVVMSSGSMVRSSLGAEIDKHDAVIRFNTAPTEGYRSDVGHKTTIRLMNSHVLTDKKAEFLTNPLYNSGILIVWDPAPYSKDLYEWYKKPDFNFFTRYQKYRERRPRQPFYILSPSFQWNLWDIIRENSPVDIQPHPPSSGMLGIVVMMNLCEKISVYEFLPSHRRTDLCHYFERYRESRCTTGHYHPITFEKNLIKRLNQGTDYDIYMSGKVTLHGFKQQNSSLDTLPALTSSDVAVF